MDKTKLCSRLKDFEQVDGQSISNGKLYVCYMNKLPILSVYYFYYTIQPECLANQIYLFKEMYVYNTNLLFIYKTRPPYINYVCSKKFSEIFSRLIYESHKNSPSACRDSSRIKELMLCNSSSSIMMVDVRKFSLWSGKLAGNRI